SGPRMCARPANLPRGHSFIDDGRRARILTGSDAARAAFGRGGDFRAKPGLARRLWSPEGMRAEFWVAEGLRPGAGPAFWSPTSARGQRRGALFGGRRTQPRAGEASTSA